MAEGMLTEQDMQGLPEQLRHVLRALSYKEISSLGGMEAHPGLYKDAGLMQEIQSEAWRLFWAKTKKGIAPGSSGTTVDMI